MEITKKLPYWTEVKVVYHEVHADKEHDFILITGKYNHLDLQETGIKFLGAYWIGHTPQFDFNEPMVIPPATKDALLLGLLQQAKDSNNEKRITSLNNAIAYLTEEA